MEARAISAFEDAVDEIELTSEQVSMAAQAMT